MKAIIIDEILFRHHKAKDVAQTVTDGDLTIIEYVSNKWPQLFQNGSSLNGGIQPSFRNDEGDPEGGWSKKLDWRSGEPRKKNASTLLCYYVTLLLF